MATPRAPSSTPIPSTEVNQTDGSSSTVTDEEWTAMQTVLNNVYAYRTEDGYDPSKLFQRKVNKRSLPDYYTVIKEPMALSTIKQKIANREYKAFTEFVRDFALIPHNAQVYNRPDSGAYQDALIIKEFIEAQFKKLVEEKVISEEVAELPFLGEIPPQEDIPPEEEEEEEEDEEEEDEDEEPEDSDEEGGRRKKRRGPRSTAAISKREAGGDKKIADDPETRKKRGRPPRVDTPMEARIKNIMKAMRKPRNSQNQLMISHFERVPDKAVMPEYHNEIKSPMAMDILKKKLKRKKYQSVDQFMKDVELMFENAKLYNEDGSQIYKDAVHLQKEARQAAEEEKKKPDTDFVMEDGRLPMPNGILHNGELWKVGDWVHIQNANDLTKPIVAQIYRTWQDSEGGKWVNACWYYRPEQTVHRFDRHFFENEVVKTGQYRDHPIDEVVDRCFVMFVTRYNKGRPRNFPADKEIYVCEARYNEEKHKLNKIKTWASCLPDEVREKDYEMDLFDAPKKMKKVPSPIAYLLKADAKETDDLPKPEWGAENAPPKIGAVHKRPRDPKESPPPEPTPSPPPQPPPPPPRQPSAISTPQQSNGFPNTPRSDYPIATAPSQPPVAPPTPSQPHMPPTFPQQHGQHYHQHSASPVPPIPHPSPAPQAPAYSPLPTPQHYPPQQVPPQPAQFAAAQPPSLYQPPSVIRQAPNYKAPVPPEVYHLNDAANLSIPPEIREQFQRDEYGRVLFFTAPPLDTLTPVRPGAALGHSARYLAAKAQRDKLLAEKRKREAAEQGNRNADGKKAKHMTGSEFEDRLEETIVKGLEVMELQMMEATARDFQSLYGDRAKEAVEVEMEFLKMAQDQAQRNKRIAGERVKASKEKEGVKIKGLAGGLVDS